MRILAALGLSLALVTVGCTTRDETDARETSAETSTGTPTEAAAPTHSAEPSRRTYMCNFRDLVGVVVRPEQERIEILETSQEFAGDSGLPATGEGTEIAVLTAEGLTVGQRCREAQPAARAVQEAMAGPWPQSAPTWLRCGLYGDVHLDVRRERGGYALSIGESVRATILENGRGGISFTSSCRRFVVTGAPIP